MTGYAKIRTWFLAGFAFFAVIAAATFIRNLTWEDASYGIVNAHGVIERLEELSFQTKDAEDQVRTFLANPDRHDLERCLLNLQRARDLAGQIESMAADNPAHDSPAQRRYTRTIRDLVDRQRETLAEAARSARPEALAAALTSLDSAGFDFNLRSAVLALETEERGILRDRSAFQDRTAGSGRILLATVVLGFLVLAFVGCRRILTDLEERAAMERALIAKEEQYRKVVELAGDAICRTDEQGRFTFCNQAALAMLHFDRNEVLGRSYLKLIRQDKRRQATRFYLRQFGRRQKNTYYEFPIVDGHGVERWIGQNVQLVLEADKIVGFQAIARDISERKRVELELRKNRRFIERIAATTPGVLYVYDLVEQRNIYKNREGFAVLGYAAEGIRETPGLLYKVLHPDDLPLMRAHHEALRYAQDGEVRRIEYRARHNAGHWVWISGRDTPFERGPDGLVNQIVGISQDITARKAAQDRLAYQANYDSLTGLANRHQLWTRLQGILRRGSIDNSETAICLFDIDRFKEINDHFGHAAGDEVLEAVGGVVRAELRATDVAGRLGGDEFCFVLPCADDNEAARVAERIRDRLSTLAFGMGSGSTFSVTATFGVAKAAPDMDAKEVIEAADRALYRAKSAGRNRVMVEC